MSMSEYSSSGSQVEVQRVATKSSSDETNKKEETATTDESSMVFDYNPFQSPIHSKEGKQSSGTEFFETPPHCLQYLGFKREKDGFYAADSSVLGDNSLETSAADSSGTNQEQADLHRQQDSVFAQKGIRQANATEAAAPSCCPQHNCSGAANHEQPRKPQGGGSGESMQAAPERGKRRITVMTLLL